MKDFKIGDEVSLDESTKPYKISGGSIDTYALTMALKIFGNRLFVTGKGYERSVFIINGYFGIDAKHLTKVEEEFNEHLYELRIDIFKTNPNLSVSEMQEIEKWLLNK